MVYDQKIREEAFALHIEGTSFKRIAELLNEQYEEEQLLSDEQLSLQYKDKEYKSKEALLSDLNARTLLL